MLLQHQGYQNTVETGIYRGVFQGDFNTWVVEVQVPGDTASSHLYIILNLKSFYFILLIAL